MGRKSIEDARAGRQVEFLSESRTALVPSYRYPPSASGPPKSRLGIALPVEVGPIRSHLNADLFHVLLGREQEQCTFIPAFTSSPCCYCDSRGLLMTSRLCKSRIVRCRPCQQYLYRANYLPLLKFRLSTCPTLLLALACLSQVAFATTLSKQLIVELRHGPTAKWRNQDLFWLGQAQPEA